MSKRKPYIAPTMEIVLNASRLNSNDYGGDEGWVGFGSGAYDAGMGQGKGGYIDEEEDDDNAFGWHSHWED